MIKLRQKKLEHSDRYFPRYMSDKAGLPPAFSQSSRLCHLVVGELQMLTTLMRKFHRWTPGTPQNGGEGLMDLLQQARWEIPDDDNELNVLKALMPFLEVIRSPDTSGPVTCLSLMCILKLLNSDVVNPKLRPQSPQALIEVVNSVMDCQFEPTDSERDEIVISKILQVLLAALRCRSGTYIPDDSVYLIFKKCFEVHLNMRPPDYSDLLCNFAESTLGEIVQIVFERLKHGSEPSISVVDDTKIVGYGLPCIVKIFSTIPQLAKALSRGAGEEGSQQIHQTLLALQILLMALEEPGESLADVDGLMNILCDEVCFFVLQQAECKSPLVYTLCYRFFHLCLLNFRSKMKIQLQALYMSFYLRPLSQKPDQNKQIRELCLESLIDLTKHKWFFREFYINYDCDIHCHNVVQQTITLLSQSVLPGTAKLKRQNLLSLQCLRSFLSSIEPNPGWRNMSADASMESLEALQKKLEEMQKTEKPDGELIKSLESEIANLKKKVADIEKHDVIEKFRFQAEFKVRLQTVVDEFNKKPVKGIALAQEMDLLPPETDKDFVPRVIELFQTSPNIDPLQLGCYFGGGKEERDVLKDIRHQWLSTRYCFGKYKFEQAFRMFLEDFQLPLETQQIDRILEAFAVCYGQDNSQWNFSSDKTYVLTYSMVMAHTSFYNKNVKEKDRIALPLFISMNRELVREEGMQEKTLEEFYESLLATEIEKNDGKTPKMTRGTWDYIQKQSRQNWAKEYHCLTPNNLVLLELDRDILDMIWDPSISSLSHVFSHVQTQNSIDNVIDGFRHLCIIINFQSREFLMDQVIKRLCELSGLANLANENSVFFGASSSKQAALRLAFQVAQAYGDSIRELGWDSLLQCILRAAHLQILPPTMCQLDDFVGSDRRKFRSLLIPVKEEDKTSSGFFSFNWMMDDAADEDKDQEEYFTQKARKVVEEVNVNLLRNSKDLRESALKAFVSSIMRHANFGVLGFEQAQPETDPATGLSYIRQSCFLVQMLSGVALHNWERSEVIMPTIIDFLKKLVTFKAIPETFTDHHVEPMIEAGTVAVMKICVRVIRLYCRPSTERLLSCMDLLSEMRVPHYTAVDHQLISALNHLVRHLQKSKFRNDWCRVMKWGVLFDVIGRQAHSERVFKSLIEIMTQVVGKDLILINRWQSVRNCLGALKMLFDKPHCSIEHKTTILRLHSRMVNQLAENDDFSTEDSENWEKRAYMIRFLKDFCINDNPELRLESLASFRLLIIHPKFRSFTFPLIAQQDIAMVINILDGLVLKKDPHITGPRIKIASLLCKIFAQSLDSLKTSENFHNIVISVFEAIVKLHGRKDNPHFHTLAESIPEYVMNLINVMAEAQVFNNDANPHFAEDLWKLTKSYADEIMSQDPDRNERWQALIQSVRGQPMLNTNDQVNSTPAEVPSEPQPSPPEPVKKTEIKREAVSEQTSPRPELENASRESVEKLDSTAV